MDRPITLALLTSSEGRSPWPSLLVGLCVAVLIATAPFAAEGQDDSTTSTIQDTTTTEVTTTEATTSSSSSTTSPSTSTSGSSTTAGDTTTTNQNGDSTATTKVDNSAAKAKAAANLDLAKAADVEIAKQLNDINAAANATLEKIDEATLRIDEADAVLDRTAEELTSSGERQRQIESDLKVKAIQGYKTRTVGEANPMLTDMDLTRAVRQNGLLAQASLSTAELLEELRALLEERRIANAEAVNAKAEAEAAEAELQAELALLKEQQTAQLQLKAEAERRVDVWAAELTAYAREDAAIQQVIGQKTQKAEVTTAINSPTQASTTGFQWPISARVTSEYGYRIHPVYRTRRLHAGMDIGAAGGTPIAASNSGVVIFAGRQGGYGNTVIVDHGGGITTLYAHQSRIGVSVGQAVDRGDIVGTVGRTGTATGNHLHFEVRVNGSPTNPRNYLP